MNRSVQAIYKNGIFRPLAPVNLPEDTVVEIDLRDVKEGGNKETWIKEFDEWMEDLDPNIPNLTDKQISREIIYEEQIQKQR